MFSFLKWSARRASTGAPELGTEQLPAHPVQPPPEGTVEDGVACAHHDAAEDLGLHENVWNRGAAKQCGQSVGHGLQCLLVQCPRDGDLGVHPVQMLVHEVAVFASDLSHEPLAPLVQHH